MWLDCRRLKKEWLKLPNIIFEMTAAWAIFTHSRYIRTSLGMLTLLLFFLSQYIIMKELKSICCWNRMHCFINALEFVSFLLIFNQPLLQCIWKAGKRTSWKYISTNNNKKEWNLKENHRNIKAFILQHNIILLSCSYFFTL